MTSPSLIFARYPAIQTYVNSTIEELKDATWPSFLPHGNGHSELPVSPQDKVIGDTCITSSQTTPPQSNQEKKKESNYAVLTGFGGLFTVFAVTILTGIGGLFVFLATRGAFEKYKQSTKRVIRHEKFCETLASFKSEYNEKEVPKLDFFGAYESRALFHILELFSEKKGNLEKTRKYNDLVNLALRVVTAVSLLSFYLGFVFSSPFLKYAGVLFGVPSLAWGTFRCGRKYFSKERQNQIQEAKLAAQSSATQIKNILPFLKRASEASA